MARDGERVTPQGPRQRALLAFLALHANELIPAERLREALWGERPPASAGSALRVHVAELRKLLGSERIRSRAGGYELLLDDSELDARRFQAELASARAATETAVRAEALSRALGLVRGQPLTDLADAPWAAAEAERLRELSLEAERELVAARLELGETANALAALERLVADNPLDEGLVEQQLRALAQAGRAAEALGAYQRLRRALAAEGLEPEPALRELHDAIASGELTARAEPGEERKLVSVLFADLVGFTERSEQLDPEDVRGFLSGYYGDARSQLERFGGTVEKFIGDAVVAVFGAPRAHEDDPERAVRAALALPTVAPPGAELRVAVTTGEALVVLGAREGEGFVAGDVVNTAARLQAAAPAGGVLVDERTHAATREAIAYEAAEPVHAKGKREPVAVWRALEATRPIGARGDGQSPFVGRAAELALLRQALEQAKRERRPQFLTVVGAPGIGKSRLVRELQAAEPDLCWLEGRSLSYGDGASFWALGELMRQAFAIASGDPPATGELKLRRGLELAPSDERNWLARELRPLLGLPSATAGERQAAFAAWRTLLVALARQRPLALVFEDVHWADEGLLDFFEHLHEWADDVPLVLVCTARPELLERRPHWADDGDGALLVRVSALSEADTALLAASLPMEQCALVVARAAGNPLYAEQFTRVLREGTELEVPQSVHAVIAARVDALPRDEKDLLQDAAVVGEIFWSGPLGANRRERGLDALVRKELVRVEPRSALSGEREYAFTHALVRDVAYGQLPRGRRAERHRRTAEWLEAVGRHAEQLELLAYHYQSAFELTRASGGDVSGLGPKVLVALRDAADHASRLFANDQAIAQLTSALSLVPEVAAGEIEPGLAAALHRNLAEVLERVGRYGDAETHYRDAFRLEPERLARARDLALVANMLTLLGRRSEAARMFGDADRALAQDESSPDDARFWEAWIDVQLTRSDSLYWWNELAELEPLVERLRPRVAEFGRAEQRVGFFNTVAALGFRRDRYAPSDATLAAARSEFAAAVELGDETHHFNLGFCHLWRNELDEAKEHLEAARDVARRYGIAVVETRAHIYLSILHRKRGDVLRALEFANKIDPSDTLGYHGLAEAQRAWVSLRHGDLAATRRHGLGALADWAHEGRSTLAVLSWTARFPLLAVALAQGDAAAAAEHAQAMLAPDAARLAADVTSALERGDLARAVDLGRERGYT